MVEFDKEDLTIVMSQGDFLDLTFPIRHVRLSVEGSLYFTVKQERDDEQPIIIKKFAGVDYRTNRARIILTSDETSVLIAGKYYYDIVYIQGDNKITENYPARLIVCEVIHNA